MFTFVVLICTTLFGAGLLKCNLSKEDLLKVERGCVYDFCDDLNEELIKDVEKCCEYDAQEYKDAYYDCFKKAGKDSKDFVEFLTAACQQKDIAEKYLECIGEKADVPGFLDAISDHTETEACYDTVWPKYNKAKMTNLYFPCE